MSGLCPEAGLRDSMSNGEFWDYVLNGRRPDDPIAVEKAIATVVESVLRDRQRQGVPADYAEEIS